MSPEEVPTLPLRLHSVDAVGNYRKHPHRWRLTFSCTFCFKVKKGERSSFQICSVLSTQFLVLLLLSSWRCKVLWFAHSGISCQNRAAVMNTPDEDTVCHCVIYIREKITWDFHFCSTGWCMQALSQWQGWSRDESSLRRKTDLIIFNIALKAK